MFPISPLALLTLLSLPLTAIAQMTPTSPDASTKVNVGSEITAMWSKDTTGAWSDVTMTLMSGDNWAMVPVVTLATNIDATSLSSFTFTAPDVTPNSAIYFLQFQPAGNASAYEWTTRFTIAGTDGSTTNPANTTQPDGQSIPWGVGTLTGSYASSSASGDATLQNSTLTDTASAAATTSAASNGGLSVIAATPTLATSIVSSVATVTASGSLAVTTASASISTSASAAAASTTAAASGVGRVSASAGVVGAMVLLAMSVVV